jgi:DNA-binding response OmpR family regulator
MPGNNHHPRALVVEDDEPIRHMLTKVIQREDIDVDSAVDGVEAIQCLDRDGYDVIVLDLMMPRIDGYGVLQHMKEHHPELLECTIIASAVPETEILRKFREPVFKIHAKPFDIRELLADVRRCAEHTS